jgi:hypothetical protein
MVLTGGRDGRNRQTGLAGGEEHHCRAGGSSRARFLAAAVLECGEGGPAAGAKLKSEVLRSDVSHDCSAVCAQQLLCLTVSCGNCAIKCARVRGQS